MVLPSIAISPARPPHTYFGVAQNMLPGVKALAMTSPLPALALALVAAHTLECLLKAYLSRDGSDDDLKKPDVRHNLESLWAMAVAEGLPISSSPPSWVACLSSIHDSPYYLRYSTGVHIISSPGPEPMTSELSALLEVIRTNLK